MKLLGNKGSRFYHKEYEKIRKAYKRKRAKKRSDYRRVFLFITLAVFFTGHCFAVWLYWWTQHARFEYALQPVVVLDGHLVDANDFVYLNDNTGYITASLADPVFRKNPGVQSVPLTLSSGWRSLEATADLYVLTTVSQFSHEFREPAPELNPMDFIVNPHTAEGITFDVRFVEKPLLLEEYDVGEHTLFLSLNNIPFEVLLNVVDTTPPTATAAPVVLLAGETAEPKQFVLNSYDASGIESIEFVDTPNFMSAHEQIVDIIITDFHGNSDIIRSGLRVLLNEEDPVIEGFDTIVSRVDSPIIYLRGVTAFDDMGRELEVHVDSSGVDQFTVGEYTVLFYAVDATGNRTEVIETVFIIDIDIDAIYEEVDSVLDRIIDDNMTQLEQARAIHRWIARNIRYSYTRGGPPTIYEAAYRALRNRSGNCFNYYALAEIMLTRSDIPNMLIERIPGTPTTHRWNLINPDGLGWHHFDSAPTRIGFYSDTTLFTSGQAESYSRRLLELGASRNYYTYDPELYPEIAQ